MTALPKKISDNTGGVSLISRDEMNLAEFPLTMLSNRADPKIKTLEFKDTIINKNGREINREWVITGTDKFGLPTASDDEVLLGLLKLSVEDQFKNKKVSFTRYELLKILRWPTEGKNYSRLQKALDRLSGVRIKATNAFYDNEAKAHSTKNFGIIDAYEINDGRENRIKPSFFIWSDEIFQSFQSGFIKKLDLDFYLDLNSSISKRLYRFLDKNFWYRSKLKINLFTLCHEKIGISRNFKYASSLKQQLEPALEELLKVNFISSVEYLGRGSKTEIVLSGASLLPRSQQQPSTQADLPPVSVLSKPAILVKSPADMGLSLTARVRKCLEERGLKSHQLDKLLKSRTDYHLRKMELVIKYFDYLMSSNSSLVSTSPVGFLYRAIENIEDFALPKTFSLESTKVSNSNTSKKPAKDNHLEGEYQNFLTVEIVKARKDVAPEILAKIQAEVETNLAKVRNLISEERFRDTVQHSTDQKLIKLYLIPDFQEWKKSQKIQT